MIVDTLSTKFKQWYPGLVIGSIMDAGDTYIVSLTRKNIPKGVHVMDSMYEVRKKDYAIRPFIVGENSDKYRMALKNIVYRKPSV